MLYIDPRQQTSLSKRMETRGLIGYTEAFLFMIFFLIKIFLTNQRTFNVKAIVLIAINSTGFFQDLRELRSISRGRSVHTDVITPLSPWIVLASGSVLWRCTTDI
jgi:lipid-A-disaccharide synthase-like uncharacterized protein